MQDIDEFEASLSDRLRAAAGEMEPDPAALDAVRARATVRPARRLGARTVVASAAAAVAVVVAAVALWSTGGTRDAVTAGPDHSPPSAAPASSTPPAEPPDATLVIYRYPSATDEMIREDPKMGGEWAMLHTAERTYHARPQEELGAESPSEESVLGQGFADLDAGLEADAFGASPDWAVQRLEQLLFSGVGNTAQVARIRELLATFPDVTITTHDGQVSIAVASTMTTYTYDEATGRMLRRSYPDAPEGDVEFVSVTRVRASDYLVPGRGTPLPPTTTTTIVEAGG